MAGAIGSTTAFINPLTGQSSNGAATNVGGTAPDTALLRGTVADILGLQSKASIDVANAAASDIQATGYQAEAGAYGTVAGIAGNNATVAGIAGDIKNLQQARALRMTLGSQRAEVAAAGFANSGSSLDLMRSSIQQGALERQLTNIQTTQTQGGYLEEGAAAEAEVAGATMASGAAQALAVQQRASGQLATANAANETAALNSYIKTTTAGAPLTPEATLVTSTLGQTPGTPTTFNPATLSSTNNLATQPLPGRSFAGGGVSGGGMGTPSGNAI